MTGLIISISDVSNGSMYNRKDDDDPAIINNRETYLKSLGITLDQTTRINSDVYNRAEVLHDPDFCRYIQVTDIDKGLGMRSNASTISDALVTTDVGHALMLPVADCVGATLYDPTKQVLMVTHLGRHSLQQQGAEKSVQYLVDHFHCDPKNIKVRLTPAPSKESFPIWALDNKGMKEVTFEQLANAGIHPSNVIDNPIETDKDPAYFSYSQFLKGNRPEDGDHMMVAMMIR